MVDKKKTNNSIVFRCTNKRCNYTFTKEHAERCVDKYGLQYLGCPKCFNRIKKIN